MKTPTHEAFGHLADRAPRQLEIDATQLWRTGRRRRALSITGIASGAVAAALIGLVAITAGYGRTTSPQPAGTTLITTTEQVRSGIAAEMARKPGWPQRDVVVRSGTVEVPFGPKDPADYLTWAKGLGERYGDKAPLRLNYVADRPGVPTLATLEATKTDVNNALNPSATSAHLSWGVSLSTFDGAVLVTHENTTDPAFTQELARLQQKYGDLIKVETTSQPGSPA